MLNLVLTGLISFAITLIAIPAIIKVAAEKKLFDLPDSRKIHTRPIASLGGIGIFIGFLLAALLFIFNKDNNEFRYFLVSSVVIFFLGLKDDILILSASKKFLGQLAAAAVIIHLGHIRIESMHGILGIGTLPEMVSIALSYITIIVVINAFNLIDGVDGLAGSLGIITTSIFGSYFYMVHMVDYSLFAFAMSGSLMAFLLFNFHPAKIFMGDSGSLLLGLVNAILVIKFISVSDKPGVQLHIASGVALGFSVLIVPLLDTLRVFSIRIAKGRSPFAPDRNHIHHLLLDRGLNHKQVTLTCAGLNLSFIGMAWFGSMLGSTYLLFSMVLISYGLIGCMYYLWKPAAKVRLSTAYKQIGDASIVAKHTIIRKKETSVLEVVNEK
jgi:UDP-N-acetylmuramyl pentapeptide phosphotransferase/UDP-N-acetylglucosamine-1-phosphate transferase